MSKFKSVRIAITPEQPLDEVVETLESKGYKKYSWCGLDKISHIVTWDDGDYSDYSLDRLVSFFDLEDIYKEITLAELKEM